MNGPGFCLYIVGRLYGITRRRLGQAVEAAGGTLASRPSRKVSVVAFGYSSALSVLAEAPPLRLPEGIPPAATLISERGLRRQLGLMSAAPERHDITLAELQHAVHLDEETIRCLCLYDVLEPSDDRFSFWDMRAAREAKRLIDAGYGLDELAEASTLLRRSGRGLFDTSITDAPWGELMQQVGGRLGRLNGQYELPFREDCEKVDEIFARAEECEQTGDLESAERLYRIAASIDQSDPVIPFNLGNVLHALHRPLEALIAYQMSAARDPSFAEAWINMASVLEELGRTNDAEKCLRRALDASPNSQAALYNLGLLLTRGGQYRHAHQVWARYLSLRPASEGAQIAKYLKSLSRLEAASASESGVADLEITYDGHNSAPERLNEAPSRLL